MHYYRGNPSKSPYMSTVWSPQNWSILKWLCAAQVPTPLLWTCEQCRQVVLDLCTWTIPARRTATLQLTFLQNKIQALPYKVIQMTGAIVQCGRCIEGEMYLFMARFLNIISFKFQFPTAPAMPGAPSGLATTSFSSFSRHEAMDTDTRSACPSRKRLDGHGVVATAAPRSTPENWANCGKMQWKWLCWLLCDSKMSIFDIKRSLEHTSYIYMDINMCENIYILYTCIFC